MQRPLVDIEIRDVGDLPVGSSRVTIKRDLTGCIEFKATGNASLSDRAIAADDYKVGEVMDAATTVLGQHGSSQVRIHGAHPRNVSRNGIGAITATGLASRVDYSFPGDEPVASIIVWVANMRRPANALWPRNTTRIIGPGRRSIDRGPPRRGRVEPSPGTTDSMRRDHFRASWKHSGGCAELFIGDAVAAADETDVDRGFVEFRALEGSMPTDDEREHVVTMVGYLLGTDLVTIGASAYSASRDIVSATAFAFSGDRRKLDGQVPPLPLVNAQWFDEAVFGGALESVQNSPLSLDHPIWLYWLSARVPLDVQPALLGAAIESLRADYFVTTSQKLGSTLLTDQHWSPVSRALTSAFEGATALPELVDAPKKEVKILAGKLKGLNSRSSNMQYDEFFAALGLRTGAVEEDALRQRNKPAHGYRFREAEYNALIMRVAALRALFNRCVLAASGAAASYVDYSTFGHPARGLAVPLGGPRGDEKPASSPKA